MHQLTVVIITKNEERNIGRALDSVSKIADEIIVVDSYSTDQTKAICEKKGAHFIQSEWKGYAATKNFANSLAKSEYIFSLDADEAVDKVLEESILSEKNKGLSGVYLVNRLTNYCGKWIYHSGWYPDKKIRIFPKEGTRWVGEFVHEEIEFKEIIKPKELVGNLEHYSYYSFEDHQTRADKYSLLTAQKMVSKGKSAGLFKPYLSAIGRFISMFLLKRGFLDGKMGWKIAIISAKSNILKYRELRRLSQL